MTAPSRLPVLLCRVPQPAGPAAERQALLNEDERKESDPQVDDSSAEQPPTASPDEVVLEPVDANGAAASGATAAAVPTNSPAPTGAVHVVTATGASAQEPASASPAQGAAVPPAPVDEDFIRNLIEQELGPPRFSASHRPDKPVKPSAVEQPAVSSSRPSASAAVSHTAAQPTPSPASKAVATAGTAHGIDNGQMLTLEELLDQEFGPPKFAMPKLAADALPAPSEASGPASAGLTGNKRPAPSPRDACELPADETAAVEGGSFMPLTFVVTEGPTAGMTFVADKADVEVRLRTRSWEDEWYASAQFTPFLLWESRASLHQHVCGSRIRRWSWVTSVPCLFLAAVQGRAAAGLQLPDP